MWCIKGLLVAGNRRDSLWPYYILLHIYTINIDMPLSPSFLTESYQTTMQTSSCIAQQLLVKVHDKQFLVNTLPEITKWGRVKSKHHFFQHVGP